MNGSPLVSVIVPVYNAGEYLDQALHSARNQTHENLEILCLNDGSTDSSPDIIRKHAAEDERIVVIDKQNEGYGATCNRGIEAANGAWISILEPDDWIEPDMFESMLKFASGFDVPIDIIKTPFYRVMTDGEREERYNCNYKGLIHPLRQPFLIADAPRLLRHHPSIWSALYSKRFLDERRIRFRPIPGAGWSDNHFLVETLCQAMNIIYLDEPFYCYRADTDEKERAFAKSNPTLPFERWHEMLDIMEGLGVSDARTLGAHYGRGFTYMSGVIEHNDPDSPNMRILLARMFGRMDADIVMADPEISPGCKRLFAEIRGIEGPDKLEDVRYAAYLAKRAAHNVKNTGLQETLRTIGKYLRRRTAREGGR